MNDLAYKVFCRLREKNLKISAAESCTGGLFTKLITDIPGSSEVLDLSIVTYANAAKVKFLGVSEKSIADYDVVSEEVAVQTLYIITAGVQMARGICDAFSADVGVGITGIAGPGGGTAEKPVGLVWTAVCYEGRVYPKRLLLDGDREAVRAGACAEIFKGLLEIL